MNRILPSLLMLLSQSAWVHAQTCFGGFCYPAQPSARLVLPIDSQSPVTNHQSPFPHNAHCRIQVGDGASNSSFVGSGTLISKNDVTGLVLTCSHLFDGAASNTSVESIVVTFPNGGRFGARLIDRDPANDLAALLIQRPDSEPLTIEDGEPNGMLTACGYGGNGQFRSVSGTVSGAVQAVGATFPSLKIGGAVRPGDSGGGVLDRAGRLVGVVWGCRDGETYLTCGTSLRNFLQRILPGERASARGRTTPTNSTEPTKPTEPTIDWQAWRDDIDARLAALDAKKQDRGDYLQPGDLQSYIKQADVERIEKSTATRIESLQTTLFNCIEQRVSTHSPGLFSGLSLGKLLAGTLGLSGPVALAVIIAGGLAGRRAKKRMSAAPSSMPPAPRSTPIAVDSPPPPQQTVPESHYVPVERDDFARAHQWAREQVARKYPGATEVLTTLESLIKQQLAGNH